VIRAADLYLAEVLGRIRLVGVDVSTTTLFAPSRPAPAAPATDPDRVIDWAAVQPFGDTGQQGAPEVRLRTSHEGLNSPATGRAGRLVGGPAPKRAQELLAALTPDEAADALEEMQPEDLAQLLREADPARAAELVAWMEPDEAADALRDLPTEHRNELLQLMPADKAAPLLELLGYREDQAGGFMTTTLVVGQQRDSAAEVADRLAEARHHDVDIDAVAVVDSEGRLVADLPLLDLLFALRKKPDARIGSLVDREDLVTVGPNAPVIEVAKQLVEARRLSLVVVEDEKPIGRILADDVLDALVPTRGRFHFPRLFE